MRIRTEEMEKLFAEKEMSKNRGKTESFSEREKRGKWVFSVSEK